jgi:hypothetical protein
MDPYLERRTLWHSFHTRFVVAVAETLYALLPEHYYTSVEQRSYLLINDDPEEVQLPDVAVVGGSKVWGDSRNVAVGARPGIEVLVPAPAELQQRYVEIRDLRDRERVVTVIEVLSPSNKRPGVGRDDYIAKREDVLTSRTNLVEIDLLRSGPRMPAFGAPLGMDYSVLIARASTRPRAQLLPFSVRDRFPTLTLPLQPGEPEPEVPLAVAFERVYRTGRYQMRLRYDEAPEPPLSDEDERWSDALLRAKGHR